MIVIVPNSLQLLACSVGEYDDVDGPEWDAERSYLEGEIVRFGHIVYEATALEADEDLQVIPNIGFQPNLWCEGTSARWQELRATWPYQMLDIYVDTQTVAPLGEQLIFDVPFTSATSFALINMVGSTCRATILDRHGLVWFDKTYNLLEDLQNVRREQLIYDYMFSMMRGSKNVTYIQKIDALTEADMGVLYGGTLHVELTGTDFNPPAIGHVVVGRHLRLGQTQDKVQLSIKDYSKKTTDDFGTTRFVRRSYTRDMELDLWIDKGMLDYVMNGLAEIRATPCLFRGTNEDGQYSSLVLYGWYNDANVVLETYDHCVLNIKIEGMI